MNREKATAPENRQSAAAGQQTATQDAIMQQQEELSLGRREQKLLNVSTSWYLKAENENNHWAGKKTRRAKQTDQQLFSLLISLALIFWRKQQVFSNLRLSINQIMQMISD